MPIFRVKSVKIYTGQKNLHWRRQPRQRQLWGMHQIQNGLFPLTYRVRFTEQVQFWIFDCNAVICWVPWTWKNLLSWSSEGLERIPAHYGVNRTWLEFHWKGIALTVVECTMTVQFHMIQYTTEKNDLNFVWSTWPSRFKVMLNKFKIWPNTASQLGESIEWP